MPPNELSRRASQVRVSSFRPAPVRLPFFTTDCRRYRCPTHSGRRATYQMAFDRQLGLDGLVLWLSKSAVLRRDEWCDLGSEPGGLEAVSPGPVPARGVVSHFHCLRLAAAWFCTYASAELSAP